MNSLLSLPESVGTTGAILACRSRDSIEVGVSHSARHSGVAALSMIVRAPQWMD